jgi:hypothetical protein
VDRPRQSLVGQADCKIKEGPGGHAAFGYSGREAESEERHVDLLQLDRREALVAGYRKTHGRILAIFERALQHSDVDAHVLCHDLNEADDHGRLGWYLTGTGQLLSPLRAFRATHPKAWDACAAALT